MSTAAHVRAVQDLLLDRKMGASDVAIYAGLVNTVLQGLGLIDEPMKVLLFSPFTIGLVLTYNNLPFMVLAIWVSAEMVDRRLIEAARDLGARPVDAFFRVILPLTVTAGSGPVLPAIVAGVFSAALIVAVILGLRALVLRARGR